MSDVNLILNELNILSSALFYGRGWGGLSADEKQIVATIYAANVVAQAAERPRQVGGPR